MGRRTSWLGASAGQQDRVDLPQPLEVDREPVGEHGIEHEPEQVPGTRRHVHCAVRSRRRRIRPRADDQQPVCPEVHGRTEGRELPHRSVAVVVAVHRPAGKMNGIAALAISTSTSIFAPHAGPAHARPLLRGRRRLEERHCAPGRVTGRRDGERLDAPCLDICSDALERDGAQQQVPQRRGVEQRARGRQQPAAGRNGQHPVQARAQHRRRIGPDHLLDAESCPDVLEHLHRGPEMLRPCGERGGVQRSGGSPHQHFERARRVRRHPVGDRTEYADLVRGPGAAASQNQSLAILEEAIVGPGIGVRQGALPR